MSSSADRYAYSIEEITAKYGGLISYSTSSELTGVSVRTLKRLTAAGELPCYQVGSSRTLRLKVADVVKLVQRVA